jgi:hypothetical protein
MKAVTIAEYRPACSPLDPHIEDTSIGDTHEHQEGIYLILPIPYDGVVVSLNVLCTRRPAVGGSGLLIDIGLGDAI